MECFIFGEVLPLSGCKNKGLQILPKLFLEKMAQDPHISIQGKKGWNLKT
jgi:hypothetical protein